jgi:S-(hydroxymethyl)glutathione dehydrogenase/alcohol dehydrogenase
MKGIVYRSRETVHLESVEQPTIEQPTDALVRITTSAICGSDLHQYRGEDEPTGLAMGHEFIGIVEEIGPEVTEISRNDRVVVPFSTSCGQCFYCQRGWTSQCVKTEVYGLGSLSGGQAEYVRVPFANEDAVKVPDSIPDEEAIFLGDIFSTGYFCADNAGIQPGDRVAVIGCGPVGLYAQMAAQLFNPAIVFAVDTVPSRLQVASELGSIPINATDSDPVEMIRNMTDGRGPDIVLEAVGGNGSGLQLALRLIRPAGTVSMVGLPTARTYEYPLLRAFMRNITFKIGMCPVRRYIPLLMPLLEDKTLVLSQIVTHRLALDEAPNGYQMFNNREAGVLKVLLKP